VASLGRWAESHCGIAVRTASNRDTAKVEAPPPERPWAFDPDALGFADLGRTLLLLLLLGGGPAALRGYPPLSAPDDR